MEKDILKLKELSVALSQALSQRENLERDALLPLKFLLPILLLSFVRSLLHASHGQSNLGATVPATSERAMDPV